MPNIWQTYEAALALNKLMGWLVLQKLHCALERLSELGAVPIDELVPEQAAELLAERAALKAAESKYLDLAVQYSTELIALLENPPRGRGRPKGIGSRFANAEDFRQAVITDLIHLRENECDDTQMELARLWYSNDGDPTAVLDSLVAEIKRYCRHYHLPWIRLKTEARRR
jgi:hypothetical protein